MRVVLLLIGLDPFRSVCPFRGFNPTQRTKIRPNGYSKRYAGAVLQESVSFDIPRMVSLPITSIYPCHEHFIVDQGCVTSSCKLLSRTADRRITHVLQTLTI